MYKIKTVIQYVDGWKYQEYEIPTFERLERFQRLLEETGEVIYNISGPKPAPEEMKEEGERTP